MRLRSPQRITLQSPVRTQNAAGEVSLSWMTVSEVWASVVELRGNELVAARATHETVSRKMLCRWSTELQNVDATWRVLLDGRIFEIVTVTNSREANRELLITCAETR